MSSPDTEIVSKIAKLVNTRRVREVRLGHMRFVITGLEGPFRLTIESGIPIKLRSATPIIIRIPSYRYAEYEIQSERPYVFWRETIALEAFVKQLRDNMEKKILQFRSDNQPNHDFQKSEGSILPEVVSYRFLRVVSKPIIMKEERQQVIGSLWDLEFMPQTGIEAKNLGFAVDCGFGERNALGFGFMNISIVS